MTESNLTHQQNVLKTLGIFILPAQGKHLERGGRFRIKLEGDWTNTLFLRPIRFFSMPAGSKEQLRRVATF